jgi:curved DNA-binding protein CbpA
VCEQLARDLYEVLGVGRDATAEAITEAAERLTRQASALANTAPERSQQLRELIRAAKELLLAGDEQRRRYDEELRRSDEEERARAAAAAAAKRPLTLLDPALGPVVGNAVRIVRAGLYTPSASKVVQEARERT